MQQPRERKPDTVMIVDDDPVFAAVLGQVFSAHGALEIIHAADGDQAEAVLAARGHEISAMTLDLSMPNQDGVTFLRHASEAGFRGRLVLISGEHESVLASARRLAGLFGLNCVAALAKPVDYLAVAGLVMADNPSSAPAKAHAPAPDEIPQVISGGGLRAFYQPKVRLADGMLAGAEALARIEDADGRQYDIERTVALAESHGRIDELTWRMTECVLRDAAALQAVHPGLRLSYNIPVTILDDRRFPDKLAAMVREARLDPHMIVLELTESRIPSDLTYSLEALTRLRMLGFQLAIDDFGTGASNIERLRYYPFTELKIDKGFMLSAATDGFSRACVETSVKLARELGMRVVAEGVETARELEIARRFGADEGQGYLFGRPMPMEQFAAVARRHRAEPMAPPPRLAVA